MDKESFLAAGIDYAEGLNRFCGSAALYEDFLRKFPKDPTFAQLQQAMAHDDADAAFLAAHTLKGVVGNLSLNRFYGQMVPFVDLLRNHADFTGAKAAFPKLEQDYLEVVGFLAQL